MAAKLTIIYDNPKDPKAFEEHYAAVHVALIGKIPSVKRLELSKVFPKEDGSPTPAYRMADLYFDDYTVACAALATPEAGALVQDVVALSTGGFKFLLSDIEAG